MASKIVKGLWISPELAREFDQEVERLAQLMPEKLEAGHVGAAALLTFLRLEHDKRKLEAIRDAKNYALDRAIEALPSVAHYPGENGRKNGGSRSIRRRRAKVAATGRPLRG